jgi:hypothetical protein
MSARLSRVIRSMPTVSRHADTLYRHADSVRSGRSKKPNGWTARGIARAAAKGHSYPIPEFTAAYLSAMGG